MKVAVVTGAGSGVGQSTALKLAEQGWKVILVGRRESALEETRKLAGARAGQMVAVACDIGKLAEVDAMAKIAMADGGEVEVLVNAAGTNAPKRSLAVLSNEDYHAMIDANLHGAFYCARAFLPGMRERRRGTVVNIVSEAGKWASPKAGPGYVISKFGMAGLTQAINAEERPNGIRACSIFPGDIDTPLLAKRPVVPDAAAREKMMKAEDVADCALFCINLPQRAVIEDMLLRPC